MCLALLAFDVHPRYSLVVIANRDEYHARPTAAAAWWDEGILAGRDLRAGGTWLGVDRYGRYALLTNVRDPARNDPSRASRGALAPAVLTDTRPLMQALERARADGARYNGFNLLAGSPSEALWTSNHADAVHALPRGIHGLSNAQLNIAWPKVERVRKALASWVAKDADDFQTLFEALADRTLADDRDLPSTGVTLEWERRLSAPFIVSADYGTRNSTFVAIGRDGHAQFVERSFDRSGAPTGEVQFRFFVDSRVGDVPSPARGSH